LPDNIFARDRRVDVPLVELEFLEELVLLLIDARRTKHLDEFVVHLLCARLGLEHENDNTLIFFLIAFLCFAPVLQSLFKLFAIELAALDLSTIALKT